MNSFYRAPAVLLYCLCFSFSAVAQQPAPIEPAPGATHVPLTSSASPAGNDLLLDVVVTDKSGKPVAGLSQQDFTVLDNKQPTDILAFHAHKAADTPPGQVDASTEIIFILDEANAPYERATDAIQNLETYLKRNKGQLDHPVSVGILTDSGLQLQTQPTLDGNALAAAIAQQGQARRNIELGTVGGTFQRLQLSIDATRDLIAKEKSKPGRKMVIWISPGWPLINPRQILTDDQQQQVFNTAILLSTGARDARITFYSVDSLGAAGIGEHSTYYQNYTAGLTRPHDAAFGDLGLQVLVTQTGGRAIFGDDFIATSLQHCVDDLSAFYTLAIKPAPTDHPKQFHELSVKVAQPGFKVRTRSGYYAQP